MKTLHLKPLAAAIGLALAGPAFAVTFDFSGSNIYMKFMDGNQIKANAGGPGIDGSSSIDTASGTDQGQFTEINLVFKATISKQVEAGGRIQSRSSNAYWTDFGGFGKEGATNGDQVNTQKYMKLRGAYVLLTPGYNWLDQALIGSSQWGQFDPFTVGAVRYIDRDNYNGLYFKGKLPLAGSSWEFARVSLPNYLQSNFGQGPSCCSSDSTQYNEAVYIGQAKAQFGPARLSTSYQWFNDHSLSTDSTPNNGQDVQTFAKNKVFMLKGEGSVIDGVDIKGAYYHSQYDAPLFDQPWINSPKSSISDRAFKFDLALSNLGGSGLSLNYQYFDIGAGYYSNTAARRESDVLLTEGSDSAWYGWGNSIWLGGAAKDYQQSAASPRCYTGGATVCKGDSGLKGSANGLLDNAYMDFDEPPNESVQGWKGHTLTANYEIAKVNLAAEYSRIGYNYNWQNYSATGPLSNYFNLNNDRSTNLFVFKAGYVVPLAGGVELGFKYKRVDDKNNGQISNATDDRDTKDSGYTLSAGNQLFRDLYGNLSYGRYTRDITTSGAKFANDKNIWSARFGYNLPGFEVGLIAQWVKGNGDPGETGTRVDINQYRMKTFAQVNF
jgi:hypothetical protein